MNAERPGNSTDKCSQQHTGQSAHVNDQLELIRLVHPYACGVDPGKGSQLFCPEAGMHFFFGFYITGAHCHNLGAERQYIPIPGNRQNIFTDQLCLIFTDFHKMSLDGKAVITPAVFSCQRSAVKKSDAILFPALILKISGWNNAHKTPPVYSLQIIITIQV